MYYILDDNFNVINCPDIFVFSSFFNDFSKRRIETSVISDECRLSTVFLGIDCNFDIKNPPLVFESLWFGGIHSDNQRRYSTYIDAVKGHREMLIDYLKEIQTL